MIYKIYESPIYEAVGTKNIDIVRILLTRDDIRINDTNIIDICFLLCSIKSYFNDIFNDKYLLWRTIQYFNENFIYPKTALHCAVIKGCLEIVKILLTYKGIDINAKDKISL